MSGELLTVLMFASLAVLLVTGLPLTFVLGGLSVVFVLLLWGSGGVAMLIFPTYGLMKYFILLAVPLFIFMGIILEKSGVADDMFGMVHSWAGGLGGGLAMGTILICAVIAAMVGISGAATVMMGLIAIPAMLKRNYSKSLVTGTVQAGGALGFLIPPSIPFLVYGFIARVSIGRLFLGGVLPGLMLATFYIVYIGVRAKLQPDIAPALPPEERVGWTKRLAATRSLILPFLLIGIVFGCIILGITTISEAAVVGAMGAMGCALVKRTLTWAIVKDALYRTARLTGMVMWIALAAVCFGKIYSGLGASEFVEETLLGMGLGPWGILILMQLSFFILGCFLDDTAILFITCPLYVPIVAGLGFDVVWFGVLYVVNMQMAFLTPPFGYNLFYLRGLTPYIKEKTGVDITMGDLYRSVLPFIALQAFGLAMVMIFPQIAMWLPTITMG